MTPADSAIPNFCSYEVFKTGFYEGTGSCVCAVVSSSAGNKQHVSYVNYQIHEEPDNDFGAQDLQKSQGLPGKIQRLRESRNLQKVGILGFRESQDLRESERSRFKDSAELKVQNGIRIPEVLVVTRSHGVYDRNNNDRLKQGQECSPLCDWEPAYTVVEKQRKCTLPSIVETKSGRSSRTRRDGRTTRASGGLWDCYRDENRENGSGSVINDHDQGIEDILRDTLERHSLRQSSHGSLTHSTLPPLTHVRNIQTPAVKQKRHKSSVVGLVPITSHSTIPVSQRHNNQHTHLLVEQQGKKHHRASSNRRSDKDELKLSKKKRFMDWLESHLKNRGTVAPLKKCNSRYERLIKFDTTLIEGSAGRYLNKPKVSSTQHRDFLFPSDSGMVPMSHGRHRRLGTDSSICEEPKNDINNFGGDHHSVFDSKGDNFSLSDDSRGVNQDDGEITHEEEVFEEQYYYLPYLQVGFLYCKFRHYFRSNSKYYCSV